MLLIMTNKALFLPTRGNDLDMEEESVQFQFHGERVEEVLAAF